MQPAAGQMDSVKPRGSFVLDALSFGQTNSSQGERLLPAAAPPTPARLAAQHTHTHTSFWLHVSRFVTRGAFLIGDAMEQTADEMTLRAEERDKGRVTAAEDGSAWARRGEFM